MPWHHNRHPKRAIQLAGVVATVISPMLPLVFDFIQHHHHIR